LRTQSVKASATVLTQALALFLRSNFFLMFFIAVLLGTEVSVIPGNSHGFKCFFLGEDEEGSAVAAEVNAHRRRSL
jgi:hypothetical protein